MTPSFCDKLEQICQDLNDEFIRLNAIEFIARAYSNQLEEAYREEGRDWPAKGMYVIDIAGIGCSDLYLGDKLLAHLKTLNPEDLDWEACSFVPGLDGPDYYFNDEGELVEEYKVAPAGMCPWAVLSPFLAQSVYQPMLAIR